MDGYWAGAGQVQSDRAPLLGKAPQYSRRFDRQRALELVLFAPPPHLPSLLQKKIAHFLFFIFLGGGGLRLAQVSLARLFRHVVARKISSIRGAVLARVCVFAVLANFFRNWAPQQQGIARRA